MTLTMSTCFPVVPMVPRSWTILKRITSFLVGDTLYDAHENNNHVSQACLVFAFEPTSLSHKLSSGGKRKVIMGVKLAAIVNRQTTSDFITAEKFVVSLLTDTLVSVDSMAQSQLVSTYPTRCCTGAFTLKELQWKMNCSS